MGQERRWRTLKTQSTTILHHHPSITVRSVYVNDREKSASFPSSRLYTISSCLPPALPSGRKIYRRSKTEPLDIARRWTVREWGEQREVRFSSEFISRRDYQTRADTSPSPLHHNSLLSHWGCSGCSPG